ncbi:hypothetical protein FLA105534_03395 [Flavobacterium bizetiae]|uniref:Uncharacterized protein n=1 Tax=Flavobacterium bizetiae TaxID=2704140 RepID=A0A6J4GPT0_9FLAO|nr:hypothetical protein [Flavobacterium bizetiae]CAA9201072.1 hypothetical protein FLA105534_03395 [Flavobacterium bizetiae]CAD5341259.1 hypothetical protein FLA105535_01228 [Flavobacterium bizetiae]CAD5349057.1 hypothetical protein FLA105534_03039 [Flavobacterium bizetiae]
MSNLRTDYIEKLLKTIEIQRMILNNSRFFDKKLKEKSSNFILDGSRDFSLENIILEMLAKENLTLTQLKSTCKMLLTFWNEGIGVDVELFWIELKKHNIDFERNDELKFALNKNRFRRVDQGFGARRDWNLMKDMQSLKDRFSVSEIEQIGKIIEADENKRVEILKKCLLKKQIPKSQYLKFGECWAYLSYCNLFEKYFDQEQKDELSDIHRNFK